MPDEAAFELSFTEGLPMAGDAAETLTDRLVPLRQRRRPRLGDRGGGTLMAPPVILAHVAAPTSVPRYELRVRTYAPAGTEYSIWQLPAPATPHLRVPRRIARFRGRNLDLVEHSVVRRLARVGVRPRRPAGSGRRRYPLGEDTALTLGLLFRALAPMHSRDDMRAVAEGIEAMDREEAPPTGSAWRCNAGGPGAC